MCTQRRLKVLLEDSAVAGSAILPLKLSITVLDLQPIPKEHSTSISSR